jgi:hypothetical protein
MLAKGKAPKVLVAALRKVRGSRSTTLPRGASPQGERHKALTGRQLERQHFFLGEILSVFVLDDYAYFFNSDSSTKAGTGRAPHDALYLLGLKAEVSRTFG